MSQFIPKFRLQPDSNSPLFRNRNDAVKKQIQDLQMKFEKDEMQASDIIAELEKIGATNIVHSTYSIAQDKPVNKITFELNGQTYTFSYEPEFVPQEGYSLNQTGGTNRSNDNKFYMDPNIILNLMDTNYRLGGLKAPK